MTLLRSFFNGSVLIFLTGLSALAGCASIAPPPRGPACADSGCPRIAVLPTANRSGIAAPVKEMHQSLVRGLKERGVPVLESEIVSRFMDRHRVRFVGGIDTELGRALKEETGADAVLLSSIDFYSGEFPPKVSLSVRLVSTGSAGKVLWMDGKGLAGDDARGILGLGLIEDPRRLLENAIHSLLDSLTGYLADGRQPAGTAAKRFQPRQRYRSPIVSADMKYRVAVVPFFNLSAGKNAGDIASQQLIGAMLQSGNFEVVEPGVVREMLLRHRMIVNRGVSLAQADVLFEELNVDLILGGMVFDYADNQGEHGSPRVEFSAQFIERKSREVVWSSSSRNTGEDGVFFFDVGRISTAQTMAAQMALQVVKMMMAK